MFYNDNFVITCNARVIWDGVVAKPEQMDDGSFKYSLRVAIPANAPEISELQTIIDRELQTGIFKGVFPNGGNQAMSDVGAGEFGDMLVGHKVMNSVTYGTRPDVYDINGQMLDPMVYGHMLYPGATVQLILSARSYNNKSKGLGFWLNGIKIIDTTSPKLPVGHSVDAAAAFAQAPAQAGSAQVPANAPTAPPAAAPSAVAPTAAPAASAAPLPGAAVPPPAPQPAHDFLIVNGQQFSPDQLRQAGWAEEQINAART